MGYILCAVILISWMLTLIVAINKWNGSRSQRELNELRILKIERIVELQKLFDEKLITSDEFEDAIERVMCVLDKSALK